MTDIINEYYGPKGVRFISWLAVVLISYAFIAAYLMIGLEPAGWWVTVNAERGVPDMQAAFSNPTPSENAPRKNPDASLPSAMLSQMRGKH